MTGPRTIAGAARDIAAGRITSVDLTRECLDRIARFDDRLHSFVYLRAGAALADAAAADARIRTHGPRGPLDGVPIALKDIYETAGIPTTGHSRLYLGHTPVRNAPTVQRLADAGTVLLGKLATHELAFGGPSFDLPFPPARNPWDTTRFPAGSSSGSGVAIAAQLCLGTLGSDTGGSIRGPAALCGVAGIKPTFGRVSRVGVLPLSWTLDHCGPMAWTVEDCALLLDAIAGHDPDDAGSAKRPYEPIGPLAGASVRGRRIGYAREYFASLPATDHGMLAAIDAAMDVYRSLGATVEEVTLPSAHACTATGFSIMLAEAYAMYGKRLRDTPEAFGEFYRHRVMLGAFINAADYANALDRKTELARDIDRLFDRHDAIVTASAYGPAPPIDKVGKYYMLEQPVLTVAFNVSGHPVVSVCCGYSPEGLPYGMQIAGRYFAERETVHIAAAYESATPWRARRPVL